MHSFCVVFNCLVKNLGRIQKYVHISLIRDAKSKLQTFNTIPQQKHAVTTESHIKQYLLFYVQYLFFFSLKCIIIELPQLLGFGLHATFSLAFKIKF